MSRANRLELPVESVAQGRYVLERALGVGGMATVYRAHDVRLDLPRAVKILNPELVSSPSLRKRFEIEARTMAKLHHPNIVSVYDIGTENELAYMVMELADGGSLNDRLKNVGYLLPRTALAASQSILSALVLAHGKGVIHRDIKPHNVLVSLEGVPKLTDFGIAHLIGQDKALTASNAVIGTWAFMAPEQRKSARRVTVHTDVYAVGATLYALMTARDPFDIYNKELQKELFAGIPEAIVEVIERATRYWPEERYGSAQEMLGAIQRADNALRPDYIDEPSRIVPIIDLGGPATGILPTPRSAAGKSGNSDSTFDDELLNDDGRTPTLAPASEPITGPTGPIPQLQPHPTLAAPGDEEYTEPEDALDPFVDEATPIHLWQTSTDPMGEHRAAGRPIEGLVVPVPPLGHTTAGASGPAPEPARPLAVSQVPAPTRRVQLKREHLYLAILVLGGAATLLISTWLFRRAEPTVAERPTTAERPSAPAATNPTTSQPAPAPTPSSPPAPPVTAPVTAPVSATPTTPAPTTPAPTTPAPTTPAPTTPAITAPAPPVKRPLPSQAIQQRRLEALPGQ